ncbi:3-oxoacyl-[acyl-carrier-protein] synthase-3 [Streptomyces sp. V4I23]|uniref:beta-ketoacyl-ACP synthase III n=1 Tax=Streptomyces sp. V4I23 TaxID=3042282 RepID=UPI002789656D|nr:beta-ketoacyl-ACP synthase III [Streptomyces sp. V4I23]MDQ1005905.1 3-oxoacyl-[acyl-carrier-protein] synthase-3 [Streptomyces sp. V4I23]
MEGNAAVLCGLGAWVPPRVVSNKELTTALDTSDEWIRSRTGIEQRYLVDKGMATSDLAVEAGKRAIESAGSPPIGAVVLATTSPDRLCPGTAPEVATRLGLVDVPAFDIAAACGGFMYGLTVASSLVSTGLSGHILLIGAEAFSTMVNPQDRSTAVLFGDGAGAVVLRGGEPGEPGEIGPFDLGSDGGKADLLAVPAGGSRQRFVAATGQGLADARPPEYFLHMDGPEIFRNAVKRMTSSSRKVLDQIGWTPDEVDALAAHQANLRIVSAVGERLGIPQEQWLTNADRVGNTLTASIPILLAASAAKDLLRPSDRVVLTAFGAGLTWGSAAMTWPQITPRIDVIP